ncbi:MAG: hypothetical protein SA339_06920 [Methanomassiliicoccus sp.]|nr:hypothetical protein [Methanomassiliicoccus sp.]
MILLPFTVTMAKGKKAFDETKGELLYTETIPKKLQPRKVLAGWRWSLFENLGRMAEIVLFIYLIYLATSKDLSDGTTVRNLLMGVVALVLMFYVTEVISPRGRRMSYPVKVWSRGLEVHTSFLEEVRGFPGFIPKERISKILVRRIEINIKDRTDEMPTNLKLVLSSGKVLDLGRRNYNELDNIIKLMKEKYGVSE